MAELAPKPEHLSPRERQIAEAYAAGRSYREIAESLFIAPATVRTHLSTIYRKLGVSTKIELLRALERFNTAPDTDAVKGRSPSDSACEPAPSESELASLAEKEPADDLARAAPRLEALAPSPQTGKANRADPLVTKLLEELGLHQYEDLFATNAVDVDVLTTLTDSDLRELGVLVVGHRRRLAAAIHERRSSGAKARGAEGRASGQLSLAPSETGPPAERRHLTLAFVDLAGSMELSTRLDPEQMRDLLEDFRGAVATAAARFEGHVTNVMADEVLVYFGWPQAHEDDAERAIRASLAVRASVSALRGPEDEPLAARIGIASGLVVVGEGMGHDAAVVGSTPNLASRLRVLASPGQIVIAENTRRLLGDFFELAHLGAQGVKGICEPVQAYAVTGEKPVESRFDARSGAAVLPMVGRDQELALLLERWALAKVGEGQGVLLVGEAGIGKSRIARALLDAVADEPHIRIRYQCSPYHSDSALWPVVQQLTRAAGLVAGESPDAGLDKLERLLAEAGTAGSAPLIAELVGLDGEARYGLLELSPEAQRGQTLAALVRSMLGLAARSPVLVVLEDAHWVDPTTIELIRQALDRITDGQVLILLTSRPDRQPQFAPYPHVTRLALNRLGRAGVHAIVDELKGDVAISPQVLETIVERTDGVPLFVEELTKAIVEGGETAIPASLHDSLMARLDPLPEVKSLAQMAAGIGREFSHALLAAVSATPEDRLAAGLDRLVAAGLLFRRDSPPDASYRFKHALVQEAAYDSLPKDRRRALHARIAEVLEGRFRHVAADEPEVIAHHLAEGGRPLRAIRFWIAAAHRALPRAAFLEASAFIDLGLAALDDRADTTEELAAAFDLRLLRYGAHYPLGKPDQLIPTLDEAERLASKLRDSVRLCKALSAKTYVLASAGQVDAGIAVGQRNLSVINVNDNFNEFIMAQFMLGRALYAAGRYAEAVHQATEAMALLGEDVERGQIAGGALNQTISARAWLVLSYAELGDFERGTDLGAEGTRLLGQVQGGLQERIWMRNAIGRMCVVKGDFAAAIEMLEPVLASCESSYPVYFSRVASSLGMAYAGSGRSDEGVALLHRTASQARSIGFVFGQALVLSQLGQALLLAGRLEEARDAGMEALEVARRAGERGNEGWALRLLAEGAAEQGQRGDVKQYARAALEIADPLAMAPLRGHCLDVLAA